MFVPLKVRMRLFEVSPRFVGFVVTGRNHVWLVVAVVTFDGGHVAFFVGVEDECWCEVQTLTVRSRQAAAEAFASVVLIEIFTIV